MSNAFNNEELMKEYERLIGEGGLVLDISPAADYVYKCNQGIHKWKWYVGAHMDKFWFCELCDFKDKLGSPPSRI
jgi:hypothetical protein